MISETSARYQVRRVPRLIKNASLGSVFHEFLMRRKAETRWTAASNGSWRRQLVPRKKSPLAKRASFQGRRCARNHLRRRFADVDPHGHLLDQRGLFFSHSRRIIPTWTPDKRPLINARSETVREKTSFKESFTRRRCLVPADGFYEWTAIGKHPFLFTLNNDDAFAIAGFWEFNVIISYQYDHVPPALPRARNALIAPFPS